MPRFGVLNNQNAPKKVAGRLRRAQILTTAGPGAIVDLKDESVIMAGLDCWKYPKDRLRVCCIFEERLQALLGVNHFRLPLFSENGDGAEGRDVPAFRFPEWMFCPKCHTLAHFSTFNFTTKPQCSRCGVSLIPSRFVVACEDGHLADFPYEWWVHRGEICEKPELTIESDSSSAGLESIVIRCKKCGAKRTMEGSFNRNALEGYACTGARPWLGPHKPEKCNRTPRTLQRGGSNVYFPIRKSALSIPPWSKKVYSELDREWFTLEKQLDMIRDMEPDTARTYLEAIVRALGIHDNCDCTLEEVIEAALAKKGLSETREMTEQKIMEDEYRSFRLAESDDAGRFSVRNEEVPDTLAGFIDQIVLADRLREVVALQGFHRVKPQAERDDEQKFTPLAAAPLKWLPGMELLGEGIFLRFNEERLADWEKEYVHRVRELNRRGSDSLLRRSNVSARYIFLHTVAHLLIRQLIIQCGYSTSAIRERIYSTMIDEATPAEMAGILIYTATPDSEGSLGGLVSQGKCARFENTFLRMLEKALWCSSDPLCIQSEGQGTDGLNFAACHSCCLLPETSCEARNCYLDRVAVIGKPGSSVSGYFSSLLERTGA